MTNLGGLSPSQRRAFLAIAASGRSDVESEVAEEVPVAFVYGGKPHVVMMCTPADLEDLALGFTLTEEIAASPADIRRMEVVRHARGIEVQMELAPEAQARVADRSRALAGRTGCGLCGIDAIEHAIRTPRRVADTGAAISARAIARAGAALEAQQPLNNATRAVHAAAWANADGELVFVREDVGRHNALDKVIGAMLRGAGLPGHASAASPASPASPAHSAAAGFFLVTSRASYELVQKVAVAGAPMLAAVSRPTGMAIRFAEEAGITLVGLLRGESANVYSHPARISE
ncbi:MAG: formate dehydrogenase accessory sulfurtransferase FdhD [Gemmatimonadetes bacterium]|nr:formate dehydrogenase accessory sulfurtransferase FdhD [Gemmatimonadota bacterium]